MKLVFCLMGFQCNGKYEAFEYLRYYYHLKPIKTYTNRKRRRHEQYDIFEHVSTDKMIQLEQSNDIIDHKSIDGVHFGKQRSTIPDGLSVCITDYDGYKELSTLVHTVPILIHKDMKRRYKDSPNCRFMEPNEFIEYDQMNQEEFQEAYNDTKVIHFTYTDWLELLVRLDELILPYITEIKYINEIKSIK